MEALFITLSFIGTFSAGFFCCSAIALLLVYKHNKNSRSNKRGGNYYG